MCMRAKQSFLGLTQIKAQKRSGNSEELSRYYRSHNSLFVTVIFSDSKRLYINTLQKLTPFSENYPEIYHIS